MINKCDKERNGYKESSTWQYNVNNCNEKDDSRGVGGGNGLIPPPTPLHTLSSTPNPILTTKYYFSYIQLILMLIKKLLLNL